MTNCFFCNSKLEPPPWEGFNFIRCFKPKCFDTYNLVFYTDTNYAYIFYKDRRIIIRFNDGTTEIFYRDMVKMPQVTLNMIPEITITSLDFLIERAEKLSAFI